MKTNFLFPSSFKSIGWILMVPALILGIMVVFFSYEIPFLNCKVFALFTDGDFMPEVFGGRGGFFRIINNNITNEIAGVLFILSAMFVSFSKEKNEDEYIAKLRLDTLQWAMYISYGILLFGVIFVYGFPFYKIMMISLFTPLIIFIIRFNVLLYKLKNSSDEK